MPQIEWDGTPQNGTAFSENRHVPKIIILLDPKKETDETSQLGLPCKEQAAH